MADLPTNFLDDILSASMGGKRRYKITRLDGSSEEVTIEDISEYDQVGSTFGAGDINKTNQAVNEKFDSDDVVDPKLATEEGFAADAKLTGDALSELNKNLTTSDNLQFRFATDGEGNYGYLGADDSFIPFKSIKLKQSSGTLTSITANLSCDIGDIIFVNSCTGVPSFSGCEQIAGRTLSVNNVSVSNYVFKAISTSITLKVSASGYQWTYFVVG